MLGVCLKSSQLSGALWYMSVILTVGSLWSEGGARGLEASLHGETLSQTHALQTRDEGAGALLEWRPHHRQALLFNLTIIPPGYRGRGSPFPGRQGG